MNTKRVITLSALALIGSAGYVATSAQDTGGRVDPQQWLSKQEIEIRLNEMGYEVRKLEAEDNCVEAKAINPDGVRVELYVDPLTAEPGCGGKTEERDD